MSSPTASLKDLTREEQLMAAQVGAFSLVDSQERWGAACALLGVHRLLAQLRPWHALVSSICKTALRGARGFPCACCQM